MSTVQTLYDTKITNNVFNADIICRINENRTILSAVHTLSDTKTTIMSTVQTLSDCKTTIIFAIHILFPKSMKI